MTTLETQGLAAKNAERVLAAAGTAKKNAALEAIARSLAARQEEILSANALDLAEARNSGMRPALQDRLALDEGKRVIPLREPQRSASALAREARSEAAGDREPASCGGGDSRCRKGESGCFCSPGWTRVL